MLNYGAFFCVGKGCPKSNHILEVLEFSSRNVLNIDKNSHLPVKLITDYIWEVLSFFKLLHYVILDIGEPLFFIVITKEIKK